MEYELALISVALGGCYWGWFFIRRQPHGTPWFGVALFGVAALAGLGLLGRKTDSSILGAFGAIGVGAGTCMLVIGPLIRALARRLAVSEHFALAQRLLDVADILAPGSGVAEEKTLLGAMREIREGRIEQTVDALTNAKRAAPPEARQAIDERIAMLYLAAYRWSEGIAHAEEFLLPSLPSSSSSFGKDPSVAAPIALRRALGIAPPVWVELLGAYGRTGDLDRAALMLSRLEDVCEGRDDASSALWLHRGRLIFLALAGRVPAVDKLTTASAASHLSASARTYWRAVALERHGEKSAATAAYERARKGSRGMPRELIDRALANLTDTGAVAIPPAAAAVVERVEAAPLPPTARVPKAPRPIATYTLPVLLVAIAAVVEIVVGPTAEVGVLYRAGAMVHAPIEGGQWWRLVSAVGLHAGFVHLLLNVTSLYLIARFAEDMFGTARTFAIFAIAGIAGSVASYFMSPGPSAGASGAILGLLGAVTVELMVHRARYPQLKPMRNLFTIVAGSQIAFGFLFPQLDQWAHGGGLAAGVAAGLMFSPVVRTATVNAWLARVVSVVALAAAIFTGIMVVSTSTADSLAAGGTTAWPVGGVTVDAPSTWTINDGELYDGSLFIVLAVDRRPASEGLDHAFETHKNAEPERARSRHFDKVGETHEPLIALPAGWSGSEFVVSYESEASGEREEFRCVVAARKLGEAIVLVSLYVPEELARSTPDFFTSLLASIR